LHESGIFVIIDVKCVSHGDIPVFSKNFRFWLPRETFAAALALRERLFVNRVLGIDDSMCERRLTFILKAEPKAGFLVLLKNLEKAGIKYEIRKDYPVKEAELG